MLCNFLRILLSRQNLSGVVSAPDQDVAIKLSRDLFDMSLSVEIEPSQDLSNLTSSVPQPKQSLSVAIPDQRTSTNSSSADARRPMDTRESNQSDGRPKNS